MRRTNERGGVFKDTRDIAAYTVTEAAHYVRVPSATLRTWVSPADGSKGGRPRTSALIHTPYSDPPILTFWNLIEAHVLRSLRTHHAVSLQNLRKAIRYAEREFGINRLLLRKELCTDAGRVFLERYSQLIELSASGQIAMTSVLKAHLKRVEWDKQNWPVRLWPFMETSLNSQNAGVVIDPAVGFGRPILHGAGISTSVIADRIDAGEEIEDVARDYSISPDDVTKALLYERAA